MVMKIQLGPSDFPGRVSASVAIEADPPTAFGILEAVRRTAIERNEKLAADERAAADGSAKVPAAPDVAADQNIVARGVKVNDA